MHNELPSYDQAPAGAIRFNTDSNKLEVYIGGPVGYGTLPNGQWMQVDNWSPDNQTGGTRGLIGGGYTPSAPTNSDVIDYFNIGTTGNAIDFGNLTQARYDMAGTVSSRTRGVFAGGYVPTATRNIEFITIATTGNGQEFGEITNQTRRRSGSCSNGHGGL